MSSLINSYKSMDDQSKENFKMITMSLVNGLYLAYKWQMEMKNQMIEKTVNDSAMWNNDYPIILVHGYCGTTMDENWILGGYYHYAFSNIARYMGKDCQGRPIYVRNLYEADVSPIGSVHDRACELYQQIIGKYQIERICQEQSLTLHQAVYGKCHADQQHQGFYYKIKYLKTIDPVTKQMLAFPNGLPGFNNENFQKIHFVGHSMGAITVKYLQYLLTIGYFDEISGQTKANRGSLVASLTCLSGVNNGSLVVNNCGLSYDRELSDWILSKNGKMIRSFKMTVVMQNIFKSQDRQLENIKREIIDENGETVYELGWQYTNLFYDMNAETWNWNRQPDESRWGYYKRLKNTHFTLEDKDLSFVDLNPAGVIRLNEFIRTNPHSYYFSLTAGFKNDISTKARDVLTLHEKISNLGVGFNLNIDKDITFKSKDLKKQKNSFSSRWKELKFNMLRFVKYVANPVFSHFSFFQETQTQIDALQKHLCNVRNPNMNNLESIDYSINDWVEDNDVCISRRSSEFPRLTNSYKNLFHPDKPWGNIANPVLIDMLDHPIFNSSAIKSGIWYYGGIPGSDHLDLCGFPQHISPLRTLISEEYRYEAWRLIFIRLKSLKFDY